MIDWIIPILIVLTVVGGVVFGIYIIITSVTSWDRAKAAFRVPPPGKRGITIVFYFSGERRWDFLGTF